MKRKKIEVEVDRCPSCGTDTLVETGSTWSCLACGYVGPLCLFINDNGESEHQCFEPGEPSEDGTCQSDGWFRCDECFRLSPNTRAYRAEA